MVNCTSAILLHFCHLTVVFACCSDVSFSLSFDCVVANQISFDENYGTELCLINLVNCWVREKSIKHFSLFFSCSPLSLRCTVKINTETIFMTVHTERVQLLPTALVLLVVNTKACICSLGQYMVLVIENGVQLFLNNILCFSSCRQRKLY